MKNEMKMDDVDGAFRRSPFFLFVSVAFEVSVMSELNMETPLGFGLGVVVDL